MRARRAPRRAGKCRRTRAAGVGRSAGAYIHGARIAGERERAVGVVEVVGRPPVVREQQQAERDLGDEQRLCEREQVRDQAPRRRGGASRRARRRAPPAPGRRRRSRRGSRGPIASRGTLARGHHVVRGRQAGPRLRAHERRRRDGQTLRSARQAGRPLLLSQGRHARLHDAGLRDPRRLGRVRARRRGRARRQPRRRALARQVQGEVRAARSRSSPTPTMRPPRSTASGRRRRSPARSTWASSAPPS